MGSGLTSDAKTLSTRRRKPGRRKPGRRKPGRRKPGKTSRRGKKDPSIGSKGVFWRSTMLDVDTRLRVGRGIGKTEAEASEEVFRTLQARRGHQEKPPPTVSDGRGGIRKATVQVWGKVPEYEGRGRPPEKKRPQEGWKYLQVIKERDEGDEESDQAVGTRKEVVFGNEEEVLELFDDHTAYVERTHLTMRQMNGRLIRKGLGFSKELSMHRAAAGWEDAVYNLARPNRGVRIDLTGPLNGQPGRRWKKRTPAMAAGLTDQVWSVRKLLRTVPTTNT
jgi:hypothetical protein